MWDNASLLNKIANALLALAALLGGYAAVLFIANLPIFPLREIRVVGPVAHVTAAQLDAIVKAEMKGTFFTVSLSAARDAFEKLPWVRSANVRRQWPDRLEVAFEEHVPLARWGSAALVNTHGELFRGAYDGNLPLFEGPPGSAKEIAIQYEFFKRSLDAIGRHPVRVQMSARRAWQVSLEHGPTLELGREQVESRLARFVAAHDYVMKRLERRIDYIDLRYVNGFAVRIPGLKAKSDRNPAPARRGQDL
jgi:cell division protein FtsQ